MTRIGSARTGTPVRGPRGTASRPSIQRASQADLGMLAVDAGGGLRQQLGALLLLEPGPGFSVADAERLLVGRVAAVPRLRQRLVRLPPGAGRAVWLDDADFEPTRHIRNLECPEPGDEQALLDVAVSFVCAPLARSRPLWSAAFVTGLRDGQVGLLFVMHHVLLDGIGGLAVLGSLVDGAVGATEEALPFPQPRPSYGRLVADAWASKVRALRRVSFLEHGLRRSVAAGGGLHAAVATSCSLLTPTGDRRRLAVARADLTALRDAAHRYGGTVNDALLTAVAGALHSLLEHRGEVVDPLVLSVMVSARRSAEVGQLGNAALPLMVPVPAGGDSTDRLRRMAGKVRAVRPSTAGPSLMSLMGPVFRLLAAVGALRWYMARQRRFHTLVSNVPGPGRMLSLAGAPVSTIVPVAVGNAGNVAVTFLALSYAGTLTVTAVADPDAVPELPVLATALQQELDALAASPAG